MRSTRQAERSQPRRDLVEWAQLNHTLFPNTIPAMNFLPLLLTASLCLLFSLAVYFLRERLQQPRRSPVAPAAGNDLPFDRQS